MQRRAAKILVCKPLLTFYSFPTLAFPGTDHSQLNVSDGHSFDDAPKLRVLSVAPLVAEAIVRVHEGRSVSELFR